MAPFLVGLVLVLPVALTVLPDPLWVGGVYDGGDADDLLAASGDGVCAVVPPSSGLRLAPSGALAPLVEPVGGPLRARWACLTRSPPPR